MPRVTRKSLASKKEEEKVEAKPTQTGGRGKRGSKNTVPVEEPIEETLPSPKASRGSKGKEEAPKGRTSSRGRGKKDEDPEETVEEEEVAPQKRGRGGRGKKEEEPEEKVVEEEAAPQKRGGRGGRGKKEEEPEEKVEEEEAAPQKRGGRGGRGKKEEKKEAPKRGGRGGRGKKEEEPEPEEEEDEEEEEEVEAPAPKRARGGRGKKEDETPPPPKRAARGGRGKKEEEEEEEEAAEEEEVEKPTRGRGRAAKGGRGKPGEEEDEEEEKESQTPTKSRRSRSSGGRGKSSDSPDTTTTTPAPSVEATEKVEEMNEKDEDEPMEKVDEDETEVEKTDVKMDETTTEKIEEVEEETGKKRKLEEGDEEEEEESSSKKARISEDTSADKDAKDADDMSDYVVINKEDLPAADSKEVVAALPPAVEEKEPEVESEPLPEKSAQGEEPEKVEKEKPVSNFAAPSVVPLTEAEICKQYSTTFRDRDENSSIMVEVGSESASDIGNISRNLDMSEVTPMDVTNNTDQPGEESSNESTADKEAGKEGTTTKDPPPPIASIPLPTKTSLVTPAPQPLAASPPEKPTVAPPSSVVPPPAVVQAAPAPVPVPAQVPTIPPPTVAASVTGTAAAPDLQLNSIPLPPVVTMSNSSSDPPPPTLSQQPPPSLPASIPPVTPQNGATAQNGNCQPTTPINQTAPLLTSAPAKKPFVFDSSYVPSSPSITKRKFISNPSFPIELMDPAFCFSVVTYNILADCHLRRYNYSYTEDAYLDMSYRHTQILKELDYLDGDVVCMQEVAPDYYQKDLLAAMTSRGYQGMYKKRTQDWYNEGVATFVRTSKFEVLSHQGISLKDLAYEEIDAAGLTGDVNRAAKKYLDRPEVVLVCKLLSKKTGKHLTVGNIHVAFDPKAPDVQCVQVASAVKELVSKAGSDLNPYIICGDFNSETTSPAYQLAKDGYLSDEHIRNLQGIQSMDNTEGPSRSIIHYLWKAFQHTSSNMKSAYEVAVGKEPGVTSLNSLVKACLDYIFFSSSTLYTVGALETLDPQVVESTGGLPSKDVPSDHISVKAVFRLK